MGLFLLQMAGHPRGSSPRDGPGQLHCWTNLDSGGTHTLIDVHKFQAQKLYNQNWDGCRDLWKENYRKRMELRVQSVAPDDPKQIEYERERLGQ